eukprot:1951163-Rhodomonas_salina.1
MAPFRKSPSANSCLKKKREKKRERERKGEKRKGRGSRSEGRIRGAPAGESDGRRPEQPAGAL